MSPLGRFWKHVRDALVTTAKGMRVTIHYFFRAPNTVQYPYERIDISPRWRGRHRQRVDENGIPLCIGCKSCARACPDGCIHIETSKNPNPPDKRRRLKIDVFTIDLARCMYCGLCVEACPVDCLVMVPDYEYCTYTLEEMVADWQTQLRPEPLSELELELLRKKEEQPAEAQAQTQ